MRQDLGEQNHKQGARRGRAKSAHRGSPAFAKRQPLDQRRKAAIEARGGGQAENPDDHIDCGQGGGEGRRGLPGSPTHPREGPRALTHPGRVIYP